MFVSCMATPRSQARASAEGSRTPHQQGHHHADGRRDARGVTLQILQRLIAAAFGVPAESFEQRFGHGAWNGVTTHQIRHRPVGGERQRATFTGAVKTMIEPVQSVARTSIDIDSVVGETAEGIESVSGTRAPSKAEVATPCKSCAIPFEWRRGIPCGPAC